MSKETKELIEAIEHHISAYRAGIYVSQEAIEGVLISVERLIEKVRMAEDRLC